MVEHLYDYGMLSPAVAELVDVVKRLELAVDADDLEAVLQAREMLLAYTMEPLRAFDESAAVSTVEGVVDAAVLGTHRRAVAR